MATIQRLLSSRVNGQGRSEIILRVSLSMNLKQRVKSGVFVNPARFKDGRFVYPRANQKEVATIREAEERLRMVENAILDYCEGRRAEDVEKDKLKGIADAVHHPESANGGKIGFFEAWDMLARRREISNSRRKDYLMVGRAMYRYEVYRRMTGDKRFKLDVDRLTVDDIRGFEQFFKTEWELYADSPEICFQYPESLRPKKSISSPRKRARNSIILVIRAIKAFYNWLLSQGLTENRPFARYDGDLTERYGTPYYLTMEERNLLADFDLTRTPALEVQRDIFIFQCLVGCRVSDLRRMKKSSVIDGWLEYVPQKTSRDRSDVVRVPLCDRALKIIARYSDRGGEKLLPFIELSLYNNAIKEMLRVAGIDRMVTIINPSTGADERVPICEVGSSHMARRTFIGNLYKQVRDPNLVASLSGHKEGSAAFARYRHIDDDIKRDLIDLIK